MAQKASHSRLITLREAPWETTYSRREAIETPRLLTPWIVGNRGSFQPSTAPFSTSHASFLLLMRVRTKLMREKEWILTSRSFNFSWNHLYCASRSLYSVVRRAWVTPSSESTMGHAKSYVGYALYFVPVLWWGVAFVRKITGSRNVPFGDCMSIFARKHESVSVPRQICSNFAKFSSFGVSRLLEFFNSSRSLRICSWGVSSTKASPCSMSCTANF
mmetsp:Transcript_13867/g.45237  ORF Transcript_13867/g.45237 Transcript_13867/m.45237 type:complete len:217 (-) Transcript_13867:776-1426(-)